MYETLLSIPNDNNQMTKLCQQIFYNSCFVYMQEFNIKCTVSTWQEVWFDQLADLQTFTLTSTVTEFIQRKFMVHTCTVIRIYLSIFI